MGRTLKRVPMDFDWPINKTWHGYEDPNYRVCPQCGDRLYTPDRLWLESLVQLLLIAAENGTAQGPLHPWLKNLGNQPESRPTPAMMELIRGLAGKTPVSLGGFGYDAGALWSATMSVIVAAGLPEDWGVCSVCEGNGGHPDCKGFEPFDPPSGPGYQLWENTIPGSPQSPVFATLSELCHWCADNATTFGSGTATAEQWYQRLNDGFVYHQEGPFLFM